MVQRNFGSNSTGLRMQFAWVNHWQALHFPNLNLNPNGDAGYPLAPLQSGWEFKTQTRLDPFSRSNASGIGRFVS